MSDVKFEVKRMKKNGIKLAGIKTNLEARRIVFGAANLVRNEAILGIQGGPKTGIVYGNHQASAAGEYPASDTGALANHISVNIDGDGLGADITSSMDYSAALEFGTSKMAARPFMHPSAEKARPYIRKRLALLKVK